MASSQSSRIAINNDNENTKPLSLVQQRARQFEALATLQVKSKECNWWLSDFKNVKKNSCECEPCEQLKLPIDEGDIDSQKYVDVNEHIDDLESENTIGIQSQDVANLGENEIFTGESDTASVLTSEDEDITNNNDDDHNFVNSDGEKEVIEAMNDEIIFKHTLNLESEVTLTHSNDEATHATDEE